VRAARLGPIDDDPPAILGRRDGDRVKAILLVADGDAPCLAEAPAEAANAAATSSALASTMKRPRIVFMAANDTAQDGFAGWTSVRGGPEGSSRPELITLFGQRMA
jgi:hypothetical protein